MKLVREHIFEKFSDESDPIRDIGIGIFNKPYECKNNDEAYEFIYQILLQITGEKDYHSAIIPPNDEYIIPNNSWWKIKQYCNNYITVKGRIFSISPVKLKEYVANKENIKYKE